jgi:hypothetical protein
MKLIKIKLFIDKYIDKLIYLLPRHIHEKLYHATRTKYGEKYYNNENFEGEVEFTKCYWFPRIALTYLNKYTKFEVEVDEEAIRKQFPLFYAKPRKRRN